MAKDSNIVKFMDLFTPAYSTENDSQAIERISGERKSDINDYCEDTLYKRVQRNICSAETNSASARAT